MSKRLDIIFTNDEEELFTLLNQYRVSLGWTWKRLVLIGIAESIGKQGDNPDLVMAIADYLERRR